MPRPTYPEDIGDDLAELRGKIRDAAAAARAAMARQIWQGVHRFVSGAQLRVESAMGTNAVMLAGSQIPLNGEQETYGVATYRPGGQVAFASYKAADHFRTAMFDRAGNRVIEPDEPEGGLARPYVPVNFAQQHIPYWYPISNTAVHYPCATYMLKQHPRLRVWVQIATAATNSLVVDLFDHDALVPMDTVSVAASQTIAHMFDVPLSGDYLALRYLSIRAQMTGTGTAYVGFLSGYGMESVL